MKVGDTFLTLFDTNKIMFRGCNSAFLVAIMRLKG
jgi:hypothetical protein